MRTETITIYSYSELSEEAKATAYKAFEADNRRTLEAFCTAFGIEETEYVYNSYCHSFRWRAKNEYIRHCLSLFGDVIEECLEAFFSENNELEFYENGICVRHR